jgi:hypothetical protein
VCIAFTVKVKPSGRVKFVTCTGVPEVVTVTRNVRNVRGFMVLDIERKIKKWRTLFNQKRVKRLN